MKLKAQEADMQWRMERDSRKENEDAQKDFDNELMQWRWHQVLRRRSLTAILPFSHFPLSLAAIFSFSYRIWMTQRLARDLRY